MRKLLAVAALAAATSSAEAADSFYERYILGPDAASPCYARTYTGEHLAGHPGQKVARFYVTRSDEDHGGSARSFDVAFGFTLRNVPDFFVSYAVCRAHGDGAACVAEGDGGGFLLTPRPDGLLVSIDRQLEVEGADGVSPNLLVSDDRDLRLYAGDPENCLFDSFGGDDARPVIDPLGPSIERRR